MILIVSHFKLGGDLTLLSKAKTFSNERVLLTRSKSKEVTSHVEHRLIILIDLKLSKRLSIHTLEPPLVAF